MSAKLVNHHGRLTEKEVETLKASDLLKLMEVVKAATGVYNELEPPEPDPEALRRAFDELGNALRALGLMEAK